MEPPKARLSRRSMLQGAVVLGASVACGAGLRLDAPAPGAFVLSTEELAIVGSLAEVMFPGAPFPVDGLEADVAGGVDRLLHEYLAEPHVSALRYVIRAVEWGTLASRGARFSALSVEVRGDVLTRWADPTVLPRRVALDGLKVLMGMAYFRDPRVIEAIGWRVDCGRRP